MVGSKASDIAKGLALIVEVAAIFFYIWFCTAGNITRLLRFWWTISQQKQNQKQQTVKQKQQPVVAAALSASLCRLSIR